MDGWDGRHTMEAWDGRNTMEAWDGRSTMGLNERITMMLEEKERNRMLLEEQERNRMLLEEQERNRMVLDGRKKGKQIQKTPRDIAESLLNMPSSRRVNIVEPPRSFPSSSRVNDIRDNCYNIEPPNNAEPPMYLQIRSNVNDIRDNCYYIEPPNTAEPQINYPSGSNINDVRNNCYYNEPSNTVEPSMSLPPFCKVNDVRENCFYIEPAFRAESPINQPSCSYTIIPLNRPEPPNRGEPPNLPSCSKVDDIRDICDNTDPEEPTHKRPLTLVPLRNVIINYKKIGEEIMLTNIDPPTNADWGESRVKYIGDRCVPGNEIAEYISKGKRINHKSLEEIEKRETTKKLRIVYINDQSPDEFTEIFP